MSFPTCATAYVHANMTVTGTGLIVTSAQLATIIDKYAVPILFDQSGIDSLKKALEGVVETDFTKANLEAALKERGRPKAGKLAKRSRRQSSLFMGIVRFLGPSGGTSAILRPTSRVAILLVSKTPAPLNGSIGSHLVR